MVSSGCSRINRKGMVRGLNQREWRWPGHGLAVLWGRRRDLRASGRPWDAVPPGAGGYGFSAAMAVVQTTMAANLPYTALRDVILTHPTWWKA